MLPKREVLARLVRGNISFVVYGQKASGKTTLIQEVLKEAKVPYIEINCTLANKKSNFLKLFNVELNKYLCQHGLEDSKLTTPPNLDGWISEIRRKVAQNSQVVQVLDNLIVFMDNIEEMVMSESFVNAFYSACQREFNFRMSFIFCGTNFLKKQYPLELPFRTMMSFCMPKPVHQFETIIQKTVEANLKEHFKGKITPEILEKCTRTLTNQIRTAFQSIDFNLDRMKSITKSVVDEVMGLLDVKDPYRSLLRAINNQDLKNIIKQVREHGPLQENLMKRKISAIDNQDNLELNTNLEYYPNLLMTSIHLADYYTEKEDKRRFQDYKGRTNARNKDLKKQEFKIGKHNLNRIIAIADAIESQARDNDKERALQHHSLDFYAQIEHLHKIGRIKMTGNKVMGVVKEEEVKAFLAKQNLRYDQFMAP